MKCRMLLLITVFALLAFSIAPASFADLDYENTYETALKLAKNDLTNLDNLKDAIVMLDQIGSFAFSRSYLIYFQQIITIQSDQPELETAKLMVELCQDNSEFSGDLEQRGFPSCLNLLMYIRAREQEQKGEFDSAFAVYRKMAILDAPDRAVNLALLIANATPIPTPIPTPTLSPTYTPEPEKATTPTPIPDLITEPTVKKTTANSHADFVDAEMDTEVLVVTYIQATQGWWDNKITIYAQSPDGAYFIYNAFCLEKDIAKLVPGTRILVNGYKAEWAGEVEITDATIDFLNGDAYFAEPFDATGLLGRDELIDHMNEKVILRGLTVAPQDDGRPFNYKNEENKTDDLYVRFTKDTGTYNFCVEYYLCGNDTDVYKAVENLHVGDIVDVEGFLYWYNEPNVHMTAVTKVQ